ncbi:23S rRNA m(1)G-748 methyltransferase [Rathayibacter oskolensis]|uniref:23S rRNA m(1)G-748 methyltransferase n=1 Tax=Rathayibacter oskolensis TaxID=1891671 RepID=A0A1X7MX30_9MICO|nr:methyltransferase domain-containing protein [Rathayibacter oskolensis]SMH28743.1 23S rRNA m(1)G-748 methyltransferase [Rathayibacter oskolensis]
MSAFDPDSLPGSVVLPALACPVCAGALAPDALPRPSLLRCALGHSADVARQGYASLLRGRHATSGDTAAMVQAREELLGSGHYGRIQAAVAEAVPAEARLVVDLGCGTGAYLAAVLEARPEACGLGLDLSAAAARRAARAHPRAAIATADLWQPLPLADASADALLTVFAPRNAPEMLRVLRPGGVAVVVTPRERHLHEIRDDLGMLGIDAGKAERLDEQLAGFSLVSRVELDYTVAMTPGELRAEVLMGPSAHHVDAAALDAALAEQPDATAVTVAVTVSAFHRPPAG